jgi:hypothetical protein
LPWRWKHRMEWPDDANGMLRSGGMVEMKG